MNSRLVNIVRLFLAIILLPVIVGVSVGFYSQLKNIDKALEINFFLGIFSFLFIYLFLYEPADIYKKGQDSVESVFKFFSPLVKFASFCLPIYTIIFLVIFLLANLIFKQGSYNNFIIFMVGFSFILHLVFTAKVLKSKEDFFEYVNYLFFIELIYLINVFLISFAFYYLLKGFSFVDFYNQALLVAKKIYLAVIKQMFFVR